MASGPTTVEQQRFRFRLEGNTGSRTATATGTPASDSDEEGGGSGNTNYDEATSSGVGTNGTTTGFTNLGDAFDGLSTTVPAGLTVSRTVEATLGNDNSSSAITDAFTAADVPNAVRVTDIFTNNTDAPITGTVTYNNNLGSDSDTQYNAQGSGSRYLISN